MRKMESKLLNYAKLPIPVLNSSTPPNYVIMPALLAHIDCEFSSFPELPAHSSSQVTSFKSRHSLGAKLNKPKSFYHHNNNIEAVNNELDCIDGNVNYSNDNNSQVSEKPID